MHNVPLYKMLEFNKKYFSSVSSSDFKHVNNPLLADEQLLKQFYKRLHTSAVFKNLSVENKKSIEAFNEHGFAVLRNYFSEITVNNINSEVEQLLKTGRLKPLSNHKIMFAYKHSELLTNIANQPELKEILAAIFGRPAILIQSINFFKGSEQHTHSDSIHMTTYPAGGLLGVWIALEDITDDNGPLHYYPGSHKLPYYMNEDYNNEGNKWMLGDKLYTNYEKMIEERILQHGIKKNIFYALKGDVLIWHANLFHGGEPHLNKNKTRKSMVFHYFRQGDICYHEITQRPALLNLSQA